MDTFFIVREGTKVVFRNDNTSCFAEVIKNNFNKCKECIWNLPDVKFNRRNLVFLVNPSLEKEEVSAFLEKVADFGVKGRIIKRFSHPDVKVDENDNFVKIKYSDFKSRQHLEFAIIVLRTLIEDVGVVRDFIRDNPDLDNWRWFCYCAGGATEHGYFPHIINLFSRSILIPYPKEEILDRINKAETSVYSFRFDSKPMGASFSDLSDMEHLKLYIENCKND